MQWSLRQGSLSGTTHKQLKRHRMVNDAMCVATRLCYLSHVSMEGLYWLLSGYRYFGDSGNDRHEIFTMVHIGPGEIFSLLGGGTPGSPQIRNIGGKFWPFDREYLENGKSQRYVK